MQPSRWTPRMPKSENSSHYHGRCFYENTEELIRNRQKTIDSRQAMRTTPSKHRWVLCFSFAAVGQLGLASCSRLADPPSPPLRLSSPPRPRTPPNFGRRCVVGVRFIMPRSHRYCTSFNTIHSPPCTLLPQQLPGPIEGWQEQQQARSVPVPFSCPFGLPRGQRPKSADH